MRIKLSLTYLNFLKKETKMTDVIATGENIIDTVAPIPPEEFRKYFTNKSLIFRINHSKSRLKGPQFLTYVTNMNLPSEVSFDDPISYEEYSQIMLAYITQRTVSSSKVLALFLAEILLKYKGFTDQIYRTNIPADYIDTFTKDNKDKLDNFCSFLDSCMVFACESVEKIKNDYISDSGQKFEVIEDKDYVGHNVVNLFDVPFFTANYYSQNIDLTNLKYFKHQFEDYMFANEKLANYFDKPNNVLSLFVCAVAREYISVNGDMDLNKIIESQKNENG